MDTNGQLAQLLTQLLQQHQAAGAPLQINYNTVVILMAIVGQLILSFNNNKKASQTVANTEEAKKTAVEAKEAAATTAKVVGEVHTAVNSGHEALTNKNNELNNKIEDLTKTVATLQEQVRGKDVAAMVAATVANKAIL